MSVNNESVRHARNSISGASIGAFDNEKKLPFTEGAEKGAADVEVGEFSPAYDNEGPVEFEEKKDLK